MAYTDTVGDIMRVTIAATYPDSQVQEVNHNFVCGSSGGGDSRSALGAAVIALYVAGYLGKMSQNSSLYGYKVSLVNRKPPPMPKAVIGTASGAVEAVPLATQTRPVLQWQTANAGRGFRGRSFLFTPAVTEMDTTGYPIAGLTTTINALATSLSAGFSVGGTFWALSLAHRAKGPPVTWTYTLITTGIGTGKFGTQRKSGNYGRVNASPW